jgi:5'-deoxynucleotidase YfbR-like HD superfamily hydrolase
MSWMQTYTGKKFYVSEPAKTDFDLGDIAHALSNQCRFGGHTKHFYSVAQHSLFVADIVKASGGNLVQELWGLMHDATEAYMVDIPTPLKLTLDGYEERENQVMLLIASRLYIPHHGEEGLLPAVVKIADRVAVVTEARQLTHGTKEWSKAYDAVASFPHEIMPVSPTVAERLFLDRYWKLQQAI